MRRQKTEVRSPNSELRTPNAEPRTPNLQACFVIAAGSLASAHRSQIGEEIRSVLPGFKSHFLPSRFLSGSRAWKFSERFGSVESRSGAVT
jgi:hypothetical protein